eukprot:7391688-Pyramimonas_sp.AAC.1
MVCTRRAAPGGHRTKNALTGSQATLGQIWAIPGQDGSDMVSLLGAVSRSSETLPGRVREAPEAA